MDIINKQYAILESYKWESDVDYNGTSIKEIIMEDYDIVYHPLLDPDLMKKIFEFLSPKEQRKFRQVCTTWKSEISRSSSEAFQIKIENNTHIKEFIDLVENPNTEFPLNHLVIDSSVKHCELHLEDLFVKIGEFIQTVTLIDVNLESHVFQHLPFVCPSVISLSVCFSPKQKYISEDQLRTRKESKFHLLQHFSVVQSGDDQHLLVKNLSIWICNSSPKLLSLSFVRFSTDAVESIPEILTNQPELLSKLKHLETSINEKLMLCLCEQVALNLERLVIFDLAEDVSSRNFSRVLEKLSSSLIVFQIFERGIYMQEDFVVHFPREMNSLKYIDLGPGVISLNGGSKSVMERLPKIKHFKIEMWMEDDQTFWSSMFRDKNGYVCDLERVDMTYFKNSVCIDDDLVLKCIISSFPSLTTLELEIDISLLSTLVHGCKWMKIVEFSISCKTDCEQMSLFDSALTGIPVQECELLQKNENWKNQDLDSLRSRGTFGDWKCLQRLAIYSRCMYKTTQFVIEQGLIRATSLKLLCLSNFEIDIKGLKTIVDNLDLQQLDLSHSKIKSSNNRRVRKKLCIIRQKHNVTVAEPDNILF